MEGFMKKAPGFMVPSHGFVFTQKPIERATGVTVGAETRAINKKSERPRRCGPYL